MSPRTAEKDKVANLRLYERVFRTGEYFWYDVETGELRGFRLRDGHYVPIEPNERGWLWSAELGVWLGVWEGVYQGRRYRWLRLYDREGRLVPTQAELAEAERQRAERLAQRLRELGYEPE